MSTKRTADAISGGTSETVDALLTSTAAAQPTDDQLDLVLPTEGFEVAAPPTQKTTNPLQMSAAEVDAYFVARLGPFDQAYDAMCKMKLDELEDLQGIADDIRAAGLDDGAQQKGLDWSTLISRVVA
jgi:hypothetical protein